MRFDLIRHPDTPSMAVRRVMVKIDRTGDVLWVSYRIPDDPAQLRLPARVDPVRKDELWQRTCFELFLRPEGGRAYYEYNLSPSGEWAIYRLDDYRSGMAEADLEPPVVTSFDQGIRFELHGHIRLPALSKLDWRVGVSAVIEEREGTKSYWALQHPPGAPDFHHPDCFALELPAAS